MFATDWPISPASGAGLVTGGSRDSAVLGLGVMGFFIAGPMELFMPQAAAERWPGWVWVLLIALYLLSLTLLVLLMRPRIVIYNMTADRLRPTLASVAKELDSEARWAGESLALPTLGLQLHVESFSALRNVQLVAAGSKQSFAGWRALEQSLRRALDREAVERNPYGATLVALGCLISGLVFYMTVSNQESVAQALVEMLRL